MKAEVWLSRLVAILLAAGVGEMIGQTNYPRSGWETTLTQTGHGVSGTATILDERTIRLTHFSYDGFAPDMYVYLGTNLTIAAFLEGGLTASPRLARAYNNETYDVQLPQGQTLDGWNAISIWCRLVQGSFGWGTFVGPSRPTLSVTWQTNAVEVKLAGEVGQKYWLQASTDMLGTNAWQAVTLLTNLTGTVSYTHAPTNAQRAQFFRAVRN